jgi:hypothetical protein
MGFALSDSTPKGITSEKYFIIVIVEMEWVVKRDLRH